MARSEVRMLRQHRMIPHEGVNSLRLTENLDTRQGGATVRERAYLTSRDRRKRSNTRVFTQTCKRAPRF
jgi:hypothetical protein